MVKRICPHCEEELEFEKGQQFGAHVTNCIKNPNLKSIHKKISISKTKEKKTNLTVIGKRRHSLETKRKISKSLGGDGIAYCEREIKISTPYYKLGNPKRKEILWWEQGCKCNHCDYNLYDHINGPYELHHIDGDHYNRQRFNEELLCCNCHRMTDTWGFKGRCHDKTTIKKIKENRQK